MNKILYLIYLLSICISCSPKVLVLKNKTFISGDPSKKIFSFHFINDSICIYEQKYQCEIDEKYRSTKIICHYWINKKEIILKNMTKDLDSLQTTCIMLPDSELKKCTFLNDELLKAPSNFIGPSQSNALEMYGYIDNIIIDTLLYKKKQIYYGKQVECFDVLYRVRLFDNSNSRQPTGQIKKH
jgi:hypothetical protein